MKHNVIISLGSFNAALAIAFGAFAAHGLKSHIDERSIEIFNTAADFHFWHAIGLIIIGIIAKNMSKTNFASVVWLMTLGILLFSGSLYILSVTGIRWLGAITPFGGTSFMIAWLLLAWKCLKSNS